VIFTNDGIKKEKVILAYWYSNGWISDND